jgi:hypothetical protein
MLARLPMPALDALTRDQFWPTVERFVGKWAATLDSSGDLFQLVLQVTDAQRRSPRFAPILTKAQTFYRTLIEPGQRLGCVRRDLSVEVLVRLLEANDSALDGIFLSNQKRVTRASLDAHVKLVFDTFKRILVATASSRKRPAKRRRRRRA